MNLLPLAALPAATHVARDAVAGGAQVGKSFLNLLASWTHGSTETASPKTVEPAAQGAASASLSDSGAQQTVTQRTSSFSQRLANWLRQQPWLQNAANGDGPLNVELSLDQLDRPHATLDGEPNSQLDAALAGDPSWLAEFRQLALDRTEQMAATNAHSTTRHLAIAQESATMNAEHQWN